MNIHHIIFITLLGTLHVGCSEEKTASETEYTINTDYVGDWTQTYFAQYDGEECSGSPTFEDSEPGMTYTLNDDGTVRIIGTLGCDETTAEDEEICQSTWGATDTSIKIGTGFLSSEYTLGTDTDDSTIMTNEIQGQAGSSEDDMSPICQYNKFTLE